MNYIANIARNEGDPKIIRTGPSSLSPSDRTARAMGWFSIGLGLAELFAPRAITRALGMEGKEGLVRAYGAREIAAGVMTLSVDKHVGLWSRVAGDAVDIATLAAALNDNPKRDNVALALMAVAGVTLVDVVTAQQTTVRNRPERPRSYRNRSGFPNGVEASRGAARDFDQTAALRSRPRTPTRKLKQESAA